MTCVTAIVAWVVVRSKSALRIALDLLASSSIAVPEVIAAVALLVFYLTIPNPVYGTIWVLALTYSYRTAVSYLLHRATMTQIGRELEESSLASGATPRQTFFRIVLPLMLPGLFMTWMLLFIIAEREFTSRYCSACRTCSDRYSATSWRSSVRPRRWRRSPLFSSAAGLW